MKDGRRLALQLSAPAGDPSEGWHALRLGPVYDVDSGEFVVNITPEICAGVVKAFDAIGDRVSAPVDWNHDSNRAGADAKTYGSISSMRYVEGDGVYITPALNDAGVSVVGENADTLYTSPVLKWGCFDPDSGERVSDVYIESLAMTLYPRQPRLKPIGLSASFDEGGFMTSVDLARFSGEMGSAQAHRESLTKVIAEWWRSKRPLASDLSIPHIIDWSTDPGHVWVGIYSEGGRSVVQFDVDDSGDEPALSNPTRGELRPVFVSDELGESLSKPHQTDAAPAAGGDTVVDETKVSPPAEPGVELAKVQGERDALSVSLAKMETERDVLKAERDVLKAKSAEDGETLASLSKSVQALEAAAEVRAKADAQRAEDAFIERFVALARFAAEGPVADGMRIMHKASPEAAEAAAMGMNPLVTLGKPAGLDGHGAPAVSGDDRNGRIAKRSAELSAADKTLSASAAWAQAEKEQG